LNIMSIAPSAKYASFPPMRLTDRQWPDRILTAPPIWMSTDLRDGNQALFEPMNGARKLAIFRTLCEVASRKSRWHFLPPHKPTSTSCAS